MLWSFMDLKFLLIRLIEMLCDNEADPKSVWSGRENVESSVEFLCRQ